MNRSSAPNSRDLLIALLVALVVGAIGFGFDMVLGREGVSRTDLLLLSNVLTGVVAAFLYHQLNRTDRERRLAVQQQLRTIAEMNHHIRNALQVITYASLQDRADSVELIRSSVERIEWSLREVLPGHVSAGTEPVSIQGVRQSKTVS